MTRPFWSYFSVSIVLVIILAVSCKKDEIKVVVPSLTTSDIIYFYKISTNEFEAVSGGNISSDGGAAITERGACWSINPDPTTDNWKTTNGTDTGTYLSTLSPLVCCIPYYIRAYATNSAGTAYGNQVKYCIYGGVSDVTYRLPIEPYKPTPADKDTGISISPTLIWFYSFGVQGWIDHQYTPIKYTVWLDTCKIPKTIVANGTINSSNLPYGGETTVSMTLSELILNLNTTYYWKVGVRDTVGASQTSKIWSFTTVPNITLPLVTTTSVTTF